MLARISALLLVGLTLAPFTAPFPTCDLATWLGTPGPQAARTSQPRSLSASLADASLTQVRPLVRWTGRSRLIALSGPGAVSAVRECLTAVWVHAFPPAVSAALVPRAVLRI